MATTALATLRRAAALLPHNDNHSHNNTNTINTTTITISITITITMTIVSIISINITSRAAGHDLGRPAPGRDNDDNTITNTIMITNTSRPEKDNTIMIITR